MGPQNISMTARVPPDVKAMYSRFGSYKDSFETVLRRAYEYILELESKLKEKEDGETES